MQLKTFLAKDMKAALANVRTEMGPDAVIVSSQRTKDGGVVVRAAIDRAEEMANAGDLVTTSPAQDFAAQFQNGLMERLRGKSAAAPQHSCNFDRSQLLSILRSQRAPERLSHELAEAAEKSGMSDMTLALASALDKKVRPKPIDLATASALMLIGPNGAGKSACAAKLAAHARLAGRNVTFVATDTQGAGAIARIQTFAEHLGAQALAAESVKGVVATLARTREDEELCIVDTAGFDPRNDRAREIYAALTQINGIEKIGVVSACGDAEEIGEISCALSAIKTDRLIVTGLDLTRRLGALLAACANGPDLAHITRSPYVAGVLETLTPLSLARTVIEAGNGNADREGTQ